MKPTFAGAGALALAIFLASPAGAQAAYTNADGVVITNGVVLITTRTAVDAFWRQQSSSQLWDGDDPAGPGVVSPGDAGMGVLLGDYGYTVRMVPEQTLHYVNALGSPSVDWVDHPNDPQPYYQGGGGVSAVRANFASNVLWSAMLVIMSGSGSSGDMVPPNTNGIPIITGENAILGDSTAGVPAASHAELFLYGNKTTSNKTSPTTDGLYMTVVDTNHPIMQGIPVDAQNRVQIFRAPYPEETLHNTPGGKSNYEISWTCADISAGKSVPAPGLHIIGVLSSQTNQVVFAVVEAGGQLANTSDASSPWFGYTTAPARMCQFFVNEDGSGGIRRAFNALTDIGRVIFVRTCKWAMGEPLTPYQPLGLIKVSQVGTQQIQLLWDGDAAKNYKILGTSDLLTSGSFANWQTVAQDIPGSNGPVSVKLDISGGPQVAFLRVMPVP